MARDFAMKQGGLLIIITRTSTTQATRSHESTKQIKRLHRWDQRKTVQSVSGFTELISGVRQLVLTPKSIYLRTELP